MKKIILIIIVLNTYFLKAQVFETSYTRSYSSVNCGEETLTFKFQNDFLYKTDNYYNTTENIPSRLENTNFDEYGNYYEVWSPSYYLGKYGLQEYQQINSYTYRLTFDKKGGNLLFIFELKDTIERGKFYFTKIGYDKFKGCAFY